MTMRDKTASPPDVIAPAFAAPAKPAAPRGWRRVLQIPTPLIFLVSLLLAAVALWKQGSIGHLGSMLQRLDGREIAAVLALYMVGPALQCVRWNALVRTVSGRSSLLTASGVFLTSVIMNYAAPIGLAVPARTALTARDLGLSLGESGAVVVWESLLDLGVLALLCLTWLALGDIDVLHALAPANGGTVLFIAGGVIVAVFLAAVVLWKRPKTRRKVQRAAIDLVTYPARRPLAFGQALLATLGYWTVQALVLHLLLAAIGIAGSWLLVVGLLGAPVLIGMLSPLPGGAGIREALMMTVAGVEGVDAAGVLFVAIAYRAALFLTVPVLYLLVRLAQRFAPARFLTAPTVQDASPDA